MGYVPLPPPARNAAQALAWYGGGWQREMRGRNSIFGWRRRQAYAACRASIRALEAVVLGMPDPWAARTAALGLLPVRDPGKPTTA